MSNLVAFGGGTGLISRESLADNLQRSAQALPTTGNGGAEYLKMLTKGPDAGKWVFGQEETLVTDDALWAINPASLMHGWVAWDTHKGGAPIQELMVSINRDLPPFNSLPELPPGTPDPKAPNVPVTLNYAQQRSIQAVCVSGEDEGTLIEFKHSSVGAMKAFGNLTNDLLAQLATDPDKIVPIVKLSNESYKHKKWGWIYNPLLTIVEWRTLDNTAPVGDSDEGETADDSEGQVADDQAESEAEEARLAAEYAAEQEKAKTDDAAPRRRLRR